MIIKSNLASKQPGAVDHSKLGTNKQKSVSSTKSKATKKEIKPLTKSTSPIEKTKKALKQANSTKLRQSLDLKSKTVAQTPLRRNRRQNVIGPRGRGRRRVVLGNWR